MKRSTFVPLIGAILFASALLARGGELGKSYYESTKPGGWSTYLLTSGDDAKKATFTYQRRANDEGRIVIELLVNLLSGGKDSTSKNTYFMPRNFNLGRDGLSFGKFIEKMSMSSGGMELNVDEATLGQIRQAEKDFRGAVTFVATETIDGRRCDRYAYTLRTEGPVPTSEKGTLWLSDSVPFGIVRQTAEVFRPDGTKLSSFEMRLQETGFDQSLTAQAARPSPPAKTPVQPVTIALPDGYRAGKVAIEAAVVEGFSGRRLRLTLENKTDAALTVTMRRGSTDLKAGSPVNVLRFATSGPFAQRLPASGRGDPLLVEQRGKRGISQGSCILSVYEGKLLFSGSVTIGPLPK